MKHNLLIAVTLLFAFTALSKAYSVPMSGDYGIGTGGDYTNINHAVTDVTSRGVSGPVVFRIFTGDYFGLVAIQQIPGASTVNTVTFQSFANNADSVRIISLTAFRLDTASFLTFRNLNILGSMVLNGICDHIEISDNKFSNYGITQSSGNVSNLKIRNNTALLGVFLAAFDFNVNVTIENNICTSPNGFIELQKIKNLIVENNTTNTLLLNNSKHAKLVRNKVTINTSSDAGFVLNYNDSVQVLNNFCVDITHLFDVYFRGNSNTSVINNTFRSESPSNNVTVEFIENNIFVFKNNIVTNMNGEYVMQFTSNINLYSNYNVFWNTSTPIHFVSFNGIEFADLIQYSLITGNDNQSVIREPSFVTSGDLHLTGASISDPLLIGAPDPLVINDIDGQPRHSIYPYRGADEADIPLPVELASFSYSANGNDITLNWSTSSELNNAGFDIERSEVSNNNSQQWNRVGFVAGNGTQTTVHNYKFTDLGVNTGRYNYRLKQTDINGNFHYHNLSGEVVIGVPQKFELSQNYPNPFNPSTKISYSLPSDGMVSVKLFDIRGSELSTLVNEIQNAGYYTINFSAANLTSGVYYYTLTSGSFSETKKMMVVK